MAMGEGVIRLRHMSDDKEGKAVINLHGIAIPKH